MASRRCSPFTPAAAKDIPLFPITEVCLRQIEATVGSLRPENGIVLGGSRQDGVIRHVYFDRTAERSGATYSPDTEALNSLLSEWWNPAGINLLGFAHSHPSSFARLSAGDLVYAKAILEANPKLPRLALPIVTVENGFKIYPFYAELTPEGVDYTTAKLNVLREELVSTPAPPQLPAGSPRRRLAGFLPWPRSAPWWEGECFARVQEAYDLPRLAHCRVVVVGNGGSMQWVEELARCGVGQFVLIDPDIITRPNLGTQQCYRNEVGRPKVWALRARIRRINPKAKVIVRQAALDDFDDEQMARLCGLKDKAPPLMSLLCGMTDSFPAQARVNRLALHLGVPSLCGQVYEAGRGLECTFTYPGITQACHRCILRSRYHAYLHENFINIGSHGTPVFATTRLSAIKGMLALILLHYGSRHPRWGEMLERIAERNLVQVRLDPDFDLPAFRDAFASKEKTFFDETLWLHQMPHISFHGGGGACLDCDGCGASLRLVGKDPDTRVPRLQA